MLALAVLTIIVKETGHSRCDVAKCSLVLFRSSRTRCGFVIVVLDIECERLQRLSLFSLFVSVGLFGFICKEWTRNTFEDVEWFQRLKMMCN